MTTKQYQIISLIDFDPSIFAGRFQLGLRRFLIEEQEYNGTDQRKPVSGTAIFSNIAHR